MSFTDTLLGIGESIQNTVEKVPGIKAAGTAVRNVANDVSNAFAGDYSKSATQEIDTRAKSYAPMFIPQAKAMQLSRDAMASQRDAVVQELSSLPTTYAKTGQGTSVMSKNDVTSQAPKLPDVVPPSPTAYDLGKQKATGEVLQEIIDLQKSGIIAPRSKLNTFAKSVARGGTLGIVGQVDPTNAFTQAQYEQTPMSKTEARVNMAGEFGAAMMPYSAIGKMVGVAAKSVGFLNELHATNRFAYGMLVDNMANQVADASIRRASGQDYKASDMVTGLIMGGMFEGVFAGLRSLRGVSHTNVIKQINDKADEFFQANNRLPNNDEMVSLLAKEKIIGSNNTFDDLYKESRLAYFSGIDPETGKPRTGTPGIDYPAPPPPMEPSPMEMPPPPEHMVEDAPQDLLNVYEQASKNEITTQELSDLFQKSSKWDQFKGKAKDAFAFTKKSWGLFMDSEFLKKQGPEGEQIAHMIDVADQERAINTGNAFLDGLPILKSLDDKEAIRMADVAEGRIAPSTDKEVAFMNWWNRVRTDIAQQAQKSGLMIKNSEGQMVPWVPRDNYLPRFVKYDELKTALENLGKMVPTKKEAFLQNMKKELEKSGLRFANTTDVERFLEKRSVAPKGVYGPLEKAREADMPDMFVERDVRKILPEYIQKSYGRLADAGNFGANQEKINALLDRVKISQGEEQATLLKDYVNRITGIESMAQKGAFSPIAVKTSNALRTWQVLTKLSLSGLSNMGDTVKPFVHTDFISALKGIAKSFTEDGAIQGTRSGVMENNLKSLAEDLGDSSLSEGLLKWTGFNWTEKKIRLFNANAAIAYSEKVAQRLNKQLKSVGGDLEKLDNAFAYRRLNQLLDNADEAIKRGYLTQAEKDIVGYRGIADSQPIRRLDLPYYWQTPPARVVTQFKSFAYKQMKFTNQFVVKEARRGNIRPLVSFLVMSQVFGEPVGDLKAWVRGRDRPTDLSSRLIDNMMTIGGIGLVTDFFANIQYGSMGGGFARFIIGPALSDTGDWLERMMSPKRGERLTQKILQQIPVVGPAAANSYSPPRQAYKARTMPILPDILDLMTGQNSGGGGGGGGGGRGSSRLPNRNRTRYYPNRNRTR